MIDKSSNNSNNSNSMRRPKGFCPGLRGPSGENAHEQGWRINEEERTKDAKTLQGRTASRDFNYGSRDFGDRPVATRPATRHTASSYKRRPGQSFIKTDR